MKIGIMVAMEAELKALERVGLKNVRLSGIGKVNAARNATEFILKDSPDCIISSGVAGGIDSSLKVGDFVVGTETAYHDVWCGEGNEMGQVQGLPRYFKASAELLDKLSALDTEGYTLHKGLICTGDQFLTTLEEDIRVKSLYPQALACDMESAAIAQVCLHYGVPFLSFRLISDVQSPDCNHQQAYDGFWKEAGQRSFELLSRFLKLLED